MTDIDQKSAQASTTEQVYQAVAELRELDQIATRETVAELTGLKLSVVDDRLRTLVDDGRLRRLIRGVYELADIAARLVRPMYIGVLGDGTVKVEIGECVLTLSHAEARKLARVMGGFADDARMLETTRQMMMTLQELSSAAGRIKA